MSVAGGPYVALAVLCQRIDLQPDGTANLIGIVDGLAIDDPSDPNTPPLILNLRAVIALRGGATRGAHTITLRGWFPSGSEGLVADKVVEFSDDRPAISLNLPLELELAETGTYVFDVLLDETLLTAITLDVRQRQ
ncbi:MAG: hypothetical protein IT182_01435 [Acidobacteria bacterium]|nr:hypothetical protein [Acidobacteriota bacterium]